MWLIVSNQRYLVMYKLFLYADKVSFNTELRIEDKFQAEENKKEKEKYITRYIEEIEYLLMSILNLLLRASRVFELCETIV